MAPISLVLLNPLGFLCMEVGERLKESRRNSQQSIQQQQQSMDVSSIESDGQLSRKISTSSTTSLSSANQKRAKTNGCKVWIKKKKKLYDVITNKFHWLFYIDILECVEKHVVYSDCFNDGHGHCR